MPTLHHGADHQGGRGEFSDQAGFVGAFASRDRAGDGAPRGLAREKHKQDALRELLATLTPRERQVFERVVQGKINKQIAVQLGATERTIKAHRHRVMEKMKVQSLAELVSIAERLGIVGGNIREELDSITSIAAANIAGPKRIVLRDNWNSRHRFT